MKQQKKPHALIAVAVGGEVERFAASPKPTCG